MDLHLEVIPRHPMVVSLLLVIMEFFAILLLGWGKEQSAHGIALWFHRFLDESARNGQFGGK